MHRSLVAAAALLLVGSLAADSALAKPRKSWTRYDATLVCDVADTRVLVNNPSKQSISLLVRLTDIAGDTQQVVPLAAESIVTFDCASTGVTTNAVLSFEGPGALFATATYVGGGGSVDVERLVPVGMRGRNGPRDDSDTGDSDSASGDPNPS